ncbi:hypothetical protein [Bacillus ndiopicus]|uniref:hypothetical protein n=1 Tax=Bacillus ndiopicus TaxID=1347368 RepID=UPI0005A90F04|nr:hypothetical protein [Bacillus ndiopicus]
MFRTIVGLVLIAIGIKFLFIHVEFKNNIVETTDSIHTYQNTALELVTNENTLYLENQLDKAYQNATERVDNFIKKDSPKFLNYYYSGCGLIGVGLFILFFGIKSLYRWFIGEGFEYF